MACLHYLIFCLSTAQRNRNVSAKKKIRKCFPYSFFLIDVCMRVPIHLGSRSLIDLLVINNCCVPTRVNFMLLLLRALKIIQTLLIFSLLCKGGSWEDASSGH